jgi:hypothetical protein
LATFAMLSEKQEKISENFVEARFLCSYSP